MKIDKQTIINLITKRLEELSAREHNLIGQVKALTSEITRTTKSTKMVTPETTAKFAERSDFLQSEINVNECCSETLQMLLREINSILPACRIVRVGTGGSDALPVFAVTDSQARWVRAGDVLRRRKDDVEETMLRDFFDRANHFPANVTLSFEFPREVEGEPIVGMKPALRVSASYKHLTAAEWAADQPF